MRAFSGALSFLLFFLFFSCKVQAVPVNSNTALTAHKGEWINRTQYRLIHKADDPSGMGRDITVQIVPTVLVYGVTERLSLFGIVPYIRKQMKSPGGSVSSSGIGDLTIMGRYRLWAKDVRAATERISMFGAVKAPTGSYTERDAGMILPRSLQPGSGSTDFRAGVVYTNQDLAREFDLDLGYQLNREGHGFEAGDIFSYNASYQPVLLRSASKSVKDWWIFNAVLDVNGTYVRRSVNQGAALDASGGHSIFFSPGLQYVTLRWILEGSFQYPVIQDLNGSQVETDWTANLGWRVLW